MNLSEYESAAHERALEEALVAERGNRSAAARRLGVSVSSLYRMLERFPKIAAKFPAWLPGNPKTAKTSRIPSGYKKKVVPG
jgi:transposase